MSDNTDPIGIFRKWYSAQSKEVQDTIAFFVLVRAPRFTTGRFHILMRPVETFSRYLDDAAGESPMGLIGEALLIRAIVDFAVFRQFGSADDWAMKMEQNENIAADLEREHGPNPMSDDFRKMVKQSPERQEIWIKAAQSWKALRNTELSDEFLEAWQQDQPFETDDN